MATRKAPSRTARPTTPARKAPARSSTAARTAPAKAAARSAAAHTTAAASTAAPGIRARARAEMLEQITSIARAHLAAAGPDLSLRAVARELGVVSSAVYRYFDSRDALLAALADDARAALTAAVTRAEAAASRRDLSARWLAVARAVREWAQAHPHEFGLLYGVPIGTAPVTAAPAADGPLAVLGTLLADVAGRGASTGDRLARSVRAEVDAVLPDAGVPAPVLARGLIAWSQLIGAIALELSGRSSLMTGDADAWFDHQVRAMGSYAGLTKA